MKKHGSYLGRLRAGLMGLLCLTLVACAAQPPAASADKLNVTVSILPQQYFVERIGGEHVTMNVMVGPGADPHSYEPKPEQMRALSRSTLYFSIGVEFEGAWLGKITAANPDMTIVDTLRGIERLPMPEHHHHGEEVEEETEEVAGEHLDPHVWTSPELVKIQAQTMATALAQADPAHAAEYDANLAAFHADIDALEAEIRLTLANAANRKFMVFHPSWGYFARDFELTQIPVEVGGQEPSAAELAELIAEAKAEGIKVILAQPEFSTRAAETIAHEIGGQVLLISPLELDWLANMRQVAQTFAAVMQ